MIRIRVIPLLNTDDWQTVDVPHDWAINGPLVQIEKLRKFLKYIQIRNFL